MRRLGIGLVAGAIVLVGGCGGAGAQGPFHVPIGSALAPGADNYEFGFTRNPIGGSHGYVFSSVENRSDLPVRITGYRIGSHPAGARVVRYAVVDQKETGGFFAGFYAGNPRDREDIDHFPNHAGERWVVPPHTDPDRYIVVVIKKVAPVHRVIRDCWVRYVTGGKTYQQDVHCGIQLWSSE